MPYISFLKEKYTVDNLFWKNLLRLIKQNKEKFKHMPIKYGLIKNLESIDQIIYLRDHFLAEEQDKRFVTLRVAEDSCHGFFTRETIKNYALDKLDSKSNPWIRFREKSFEKTTKQNQIKGVKEFEVWLPDVLCFALVMKTFDQLEKDTEVVNKKKINGKFAYEYAPLSDERSQTTAIEHNGGIFLRIFSNFSEKFSDETINVFHEGVSAVNDLQKKVKDYQKNKLVR